MKKIKKPKTFDEILKHFKLTLTDLESPFDDTSDIAFKKIKLICKYFNGGWRPNWTDSNDYKYYPYFRNSSARRASHGIGSAYAFNTTNSSSNFVFADVNNDITYTIVGSLLCFQTKKDAEYCGKTFLHIYKEFMTFNDRIDNIKKILK